MFLTLLTSFLFGGVSAAEPRQVPAPASTWVRQSVEPIAPVITWGEFPKTLSFDPLTEEEITRLKIAAYRRADDYECMGWTFMYFEGKLKPIGAVVSGDIGVVKLNGQLRSTYGGSLSVSTFHTVHDFEDSRKGKVGEVSLAVQALDEKGAATGRLRRVESGLCTMMAARCVRYKSIDVRTYWARRGPLGTVQEQPIEDGTGLRQAYVIEDMCPFTRRALAEQPKNTRLTGYEIQQFMHGYILNTDLRMALASVASKAK